MTTTKYEIYIDYFQMGRWKTKDLIPELSARDMEDRYWGGLYDYSETRRARFDTLEEALAEFESHYTNTHTRAEKTPLGWILRGDVAWVEANEYDEDDEYCGNGETYAFSCDPYSKED